MALRIDPDPIADADAAEWLRELLTCGRNVGSWMPDGFPRYARILHPAHDWQVPPEQVPSERAVNWAAIASWSGKTLTSRSFIDDIAVRADGTSWVRRNRSLPMEGQLEQPHLDRLTRYLTAATSTPDAVWLLVWSGYGGRGELLVRIGRRQRMVGALRRRFARRRWVPDPNRDLAIEISPSLTGSGRTYILHRGSIDVSTSAEDHGARGMPPSFWWPADRAWFVSTDIDVSSTYVGGSSDLIEALLVDDLLETFPADLADRLGGGPSELR